MPTLNALPGEAREERVEAAGAPKLVTCETRYAGDRGEEQHGDEDRPAAVAIGEDAGGQAATARR
jgi:hypothetical protein